MSNQGDDADYMADEYEMEDVDDDMEDEFHGREMGGSDSDVDEYDYMVCVYQHVKLNDNFYQDFFVLVSIVSEVHLVCLVPI